MIFDHIGIFCADLESGAKKMGEMFPDLVFDAPVHNEGLKVSILFCSDPAGIRYEIVAPYGEGSPVAEVVKSEKAMLHHLAYRVDDLQLESDRLQGSGATPLGPARPSIVYGGRKVMFFLTPLRFTVELIEQEKRGM